VEPALERPLGRDGGGGVAVPQGDAQGAGPPAGVGAAQGQGGLIERMAGALVGRGRAPVGGGEGVGPVLVQAAQQVPHGAGGQPQGAGDGVGGLASVGPLEYGTSDR
jgi:hypothetical protein